MAVEIGACQPDQKHDEHDGERPDVGPSDAESLHGLGVAIGRQSGNAPKRRMQGPDSGTRSYARWPLDPPLAPR